MPRTEVRLAGGVLVPHEVEGELAGLLAHDELIPFPGLGLETELGVVVPGARGSVQRELVRLLELRGGLLAEPLGRGGGSAQEADRRFHPWGSSYQEGDHLELNTWLHRSARGVRRNLETALEAAGGFVARSGARIVLHATGGDGLGHTWSSLHVNVPVSDRTYRQLLRDHRAGHLAFDYYLPAQITLSVVDGNGGIGEGGLLLCDRTDAFDRVFGAGTMRPSRAMLVDRPEGFGTARIMNMLRALSFGEVSAAGLCATQVDCLIVELCVHGLLTVPRFLLHDPVAAGKLLNHHENRVAAARIQSGINTVRRSVLDRLVRELGEDIVERLVPGWEGHLDLIDEALRAVMADDEEALLRLCDWARKRALLVEYLESRGRTWGAGRADLLEINVHYARLDAQALRHRFPGTAPAPDGAAVPEDTSSWFLHWLVQKDAGDEEWSCDLARACVSWEGLSTTTRRWMEPRGGYWPWVEHRVRRVGLVPWSFTRKTHGARVAGIESLDALLEVLGCEELTYGDYAGRRYASPPHLEPRTQET